MAVDPFEITPELRLKARASCAELLESLRTLAALSTQWVARHERRRNLWQAVGYTSLALSLVLPVVLLFVLRSEFGIGDLALAVPLLILFFIASGIRDGTESYEVEPRRHELTRQVLELLRADLSPEEPVTLELDLRREDHKAKKVGQKTHATGWQVTQYLDPWLGLQGRLVDGTALRLEMSQRTEKRERWKTSSRGRRRQKFKRFSDATLRVRLRVNPERYAHLTRISAVARDAVMLPPGTRLKALSVGAERLDMTVFVEQPWVTRDEPGSTVHAAHGVALCLLSLYQLLNLSRALDQKAATRALEAAPRRE